MQPRFVVLEGIDGAGTTTQTARLAAWLRAEGADVHETREPTGGVIGVLLRQVLTGAHAQAPAPAAQRAAQLGLLFAADRLDHLAREVMPSLERGAWVVSDRYDHSSVAYQSVSSEGAVDIAWLRGLNRFARRPDLTVVLDVTPEVARARRLARAGARELFDDDALQRKLAAFYGDVDRHFGDERIVHIDADATADEVERAVRDAVRELGA
ncbi:MAG: dTMP kinase [Polyangiales bacterium]